MTFVATLVLLLDSAQACGGFACDNPNQPPVLQAAERIVFGVDPDLGEVEMHVQVTYEGADDFAWIVPVPEVPDLMLSTSALFTQVALATQPTFTLVNRDEGRCRVERSDEVVTDGTATFADAASSSYDEESYGGFDVTVVGSESVGPYETVTLRGASAEDVLGWLNDQGYALPSDIEDLLNPYVADDAYFVALKLRTGATVGDLAPLAMRFPATKGTVPVQLTSMAATPDMRMEAYVFSSGRGLPESYLHVRINDAAVDWWQGGVNYPDVITLAADEAGGHAFATDFHGSTSVVPLFHRGNAWPEAAMRAETDPYRWVEHLRGALDVLPPELFLVLEDVFDLPAGSGATLWGCPSCVPLGAFEPDLATDRAVEQLFEPLEAAQDLLDDHPYLSRLTSSLSPTEMTVDPVFVVNEDMAEGQVSSARSADFVWECDGRLREKANRRLELDDGRVIEIPSQDWLREHGMNEFEWIEELRDVNAQIIEQTGAEGQPVVLVDHTDALFELTEIHNRLVGCGGGCSTGPGSGALGLVAALSGFILRRHAAGRVG